MIPATVETPKEAKARGAFYTPPSLTKFLARWAIRSRTDRVLEPSCGDGAFISAILDRFAGMGNDGSPADLVGIERDTMEAAKVRAMAPSVNVVTSDFFDVEPSAIGVVDAIIGNPPYIRYHGFTGADRAKGQARALAQGVELTGLASSWAHFVVHSVAFLGPTGRLALVLPAELLHADYGQPVRDLLLRRFGSVIIVAFDRAVFATAQVDAVLLLASNDDSRGLRVVRVPDERVLEGLDVAVLPNLGIDFARGRWSGAVDGDAGAAYEAIRASELVTPLGALASVDIGFVTGANSFFIVTRKEAESRCLPPEVLTPAVRRPGDVPGLLSSRGDVMLLLELAGRPGPLGDALGAYLQEGESAGISQRYKARTRRPWYAVPIPRARADAFLPYMTHLGPRLIVNDSNARSSNLLHGVALRESAPPVRALAAAMSSSVTLLSAEVEGRAYGGGVLKLETKEAERLLVPRLGSHQIARLESAFDEIDECVRVGHLEAAAVIADGILGFDHERLWPAYMVFRDRRLHRKVPRDD